MKIQNIGHGFQKDLSGKRFKIIFIAITAFLFFQCTDNKNEIDDQPPVIDISSKDAFPKNCDTLHTGESFVFRALFTDNMELGSFNIDVHHNFDHHSHSTEVIECQLSPKKEPFNPWLFINKYDIPEGLKEYLAEVEIDVPDNVDPGDYHFMVKVTDAEGWQALKGLSIKVLDDK